MKHRMGGSVDPQTQERLHEEIEASAQSAGLDLSATFPVSAYNHSVPEAYGLPTFGRKRPLGIIQLRVC